MAFMGCSSMTSLIIGSSVTDLSEDTFDGCTNLNALFCLNPEPPSCNYSYNVDKDKCVLWVPKGCVEAYRNANGWKDFKNIVAFSKSPDDGEKICGKCGNNVYYAYNKETHALTISGEGQMESYDPNDVEYAPWYRYAGDIHSLVIESGVTGIGNWAFSECSNLNFVTIPNSVSYIGRWAFCGCSSLTTLTIPNSVEKIDWMAFMGCSSMTSLTIGNRVTDLSEDAFDGCISLTSIKVADGNPKYDSRNNCNALIETSTNTLIKGCNNTVIPNGVTSIGGGAFSGCTGLTSVIIPNGVTSIGFTAFSECSVLSSVVIPNSVTTIGDGAFSSCSGLTSVIIPNSVTSIGYAAFQNCSGLISVISEIENPYDIDNQVFSGISTDIQLIVPGGTASAYQSKTGWKQFTYIVETNGQCGENVFYSYDVSTQTLTIYGEGAMYDYDSFNAVKPPLPNAAKYIIIEPGVTRIGDMAFCGNTNLISVSIPNSVTSIGYSSFFGCSSLSSLTIPNGVTSIGDNAFGACSGLSSVIIPNSVTTIGDYAFDALGSVTIGKNVQSIGKSAFGMHLEGPTNVISRIENPFPILGEYLGDYNSEFTWSTFRNGVLYVPAGTKEKYEATQGWNEFQNIKEYIDGDVNLDKKIDWNDVKALVDYIMGNAVDNFYEGFADLNGDGHIDAADVVKLVDMVNSYGLGAES